jgi:hypothetical protein
MREPGTVIDDRRRQDRHGLRDRFTIQQIDRRPSDGAAISRGLTPPVVGPRGHRGLLLDQMIDQVTPREAGAAGDQWGTRHG